MFDEQRYVLSALSEWGNVDVDDGEAIVQILPKTAFVDLGGI